MTDLHLPFDRRNCRGHRDSWSVEEAKYISIFPFPLAAALPLGVKLNSSLSFTLKMLG